MSTLFDKLNLRPQERRLVVIVGIVVFVVLNFWLVIPMFGDYGRYEQRIQDAQAKLKSYQDEISKKASYDAERKKLEQQVQEKEVTNAAARRSPHEPNTRARWATTRTP